MPLLSVGTRRALLSSGTTASTPFTPSTLSGMKLYVPTDSGVQTDGAVQVGSTHQLARTDEPLLRVGAGKCLGISVWVYFDTNTGVQGIVTKWGATAATEEYAIYYGATASKFSFSVSNGTTASSIVATSFFNLTSAAPVTGAWHLVNAWYDDAAQTINIQVDNGAVDSVGVTGGVRSGTNTLKIGNDQGTSYLLGRADSAFIWIGATIPLTSGATRTSLYNSGAGKTHVDLTAAEQTNMAAAYDLGTPTNLGRDSHTSGLDLTNTGCTIAQGIAVGAAQNGDPVTSWMDQSTAANNPAQSTPAKKPLYVTGVINTSKAVVRPDATDDVLLKTTLSGLSGSLSAFTVYLVIRTGTDVTTYRSFFGIGKTAGSPLSAMDIRVSAGKIVAAQQTGGVAGARTSTTTVTVNTTYLVRVDFVAGAVPVLYLNGTQEGTSSGSGVAFPVTTWDLAIGGNLYADTGQYGNTDIGVVLILDHTPTTTENTNITAYLKTWAGLP